MGVSLWGGEEREFSSSLFFFRRGVANRPVRRRRGVNKRKSAALYNPPTFFPVHPVHRHPSPLFIFFQHFNENLRGPPPKKMFKSNNDPLRRLQRRFPPLLPPLDVITPNHIVERPPTALWEGQRRLAAFGPASKKKIEMVGVLSGGAFHPLSLACVCITSQSPLSLLCFATNRHTHGRKNTHNQFNHTHPLFLSLSPSLSRRRRPHRRRRPPRIKLLKLARAAGPDGARGGGQGDGRDDTPHEADQG